MGKYTDSDARCATVITPGQDGKSDILCGGFVGDHTWDDPWAPAKLVPNFDPTKEDHQRRFTSEWDKRSKDTNATKEREAAAQDRGECHLKNGCMSYTDPTVSQKQRDAEAAQADSKAEAKRKADFDAAVAAAVANAFAARDAAAKKTADSGGTGGS